MSLTYAHLKNVNLDKLSAATDAWANLPKLIHGAGQTFKNEVAKGLRESDWEGEAAEAAFTELSGISYQVDNAENEAGSIHKLLNSSLNAFRSAKGELQNIANGIAGHEHLSLDLEDGAVFVDRAKVAPDDLASLTQAYEITIASYRERTRQALADADEADSTLRWALQNMSNGYDIGFLPTAPASLTEARQMRKDQGKRSGEKISLKELSDKEIQTRIDSASQGKFGNSTIKPVAEFLSYRSWMNSADSIQKHDWENAKSYFVAGTPAYAAGQEAWLMEVSGGGGSHRKPTILNKAGVFGGKVFGFPAGVVATGLDFYYTPAMSASERPDAKIMAPKDPGRVHWK
uniref:WXG100 family type VII secretion target n=1 Tax=Streptomyces sp. NBC_01401 TaxID=2903854 RepID=A0AAU3GY15_9ACTN